MSPSAIIYERRMCSSIWVIVYEVAPLHVYDLIQLFQAAIAALGVCEIRASEVVKVRHKSYVSYVQSQKPTPKKTKKAFVEFTIKDRAVYNQLEGESTYYIGERRILH